ncbi:MAG: hypothetical protein ABIL39_02780 [candidate division WOR-3 bacterium]
MKKLLVALIPSLIIVCFVVSLTPTQIIAGDRNNWLYGHVHYSNGNGVGPGKRVYVYDSPDHYLGYVETRSGNEDSWYKWSFDAPCYFYKVRCGFYVGTTYYSGETIIDDTLTADRRIDITVYPGGAPPDGAGY